MDPELVLQRRLALARRPHRRRHLPRTHQRHRTQSRRQPTRPGARSRTSSRRQQHERERAATPPDLADVVARSSGKTEAGDVRDPARRRASSSARTRRRTRPSTCAGSWPRTSSRPRATCWSSAAHSRVRPRLRRADGGPSNSSPGMVLRGEAGRRDLRRVPPTPRPQPTRTRRPHVRPLPRRALHVRRQARARRRRRRRHPHPGERAMSTPPPADAYAPVLPDRKVE
jgi:hypothetical protein